MPNKQHRAASYKISGGHFVKDGAQIPCLMLTFEDPPNVIEVVLSLESSLKVAADIQAMVAALLAADEEETPPS